MISLEKWMILTPLQKLPNNVGDLGKIIVATGFEWLPKVQKSPDLVTLKQRHTHAQLCLSFVHKTSKFLYLQTLFS